MKASSTRPVCGRSCGLTPRNSSCRIPTLPAVLDPAARSVSWVPRPVFPASCTVATTWGRKQLPWSTLRPRARPTVWPTTVRTTDWLKILRYGHWSSKKAASVSLKHPVWVSREIRRRSANMQLMRLARRKQRPAFQGVTTVFRWRTGHHWSMRLASSATTAGCCLARFCSSWGSASKSNSCGLVALLSCTAW